MSDLTLQLATYDGLSRSGALYLCENDDVWNVSQDLRSGKWEVIGDGPSREFASVEELMASDLPEVVKWVARGLHSAPNGNGNGKGK